MKTKLLIFGISGDLSRRKLLPALQSIVATGGFNDLEVIGVSRRELALDEIVSTQASFPEFEKRLSIFSMNMSQIDDYHRLREHLALQDDEQLLVYLSVPPTASRQIITLLGESRINSENVKLLLEKPFGIDAVSAQEMHEHISRYYTEEQVYRIDHYLAKEMAQNIIAFRAGNALFDYVWDSHAIESIEIIASETIGIEGRAQFYEQTGALRDVIQGHLMQLLALVLMDIPASLDWDTVPELRLRALQQLHAADPTKATRAQYAGYQAEAENIGSRTETFVALEIFSRDPRWRQVPIRLIAGKALHEKTTEIRITFKKSHDSQRNRLIFRIQPNEGVEIDLFAKQPGYDQQFATRKLTFAYPEDEQLPDAYEQVLVDAIRTRKSLFTSGEEVSESWRILQPLLSAWAIGSLPLRHYQPGSSPTTVNQ